MVRLVQLFSPFASHRTSTANGSRRHLSRAASSARCPTSLSCPPTAPWETGVEQDLRHGAMGDGRVAGHLQLQHGIQSARGLLDRFGSSSLNFSPYPSLQKLDDCFPPVTIGFLLLNRTIGFVLLNTRRFLSLTRKGDHR